jgi:Sec-independent protein secretion pathway component TatC
LKLALFGAGFISFPIVATQIYKFVAPGLHQHERQAFLPYLIATPIFFLLGSLLVYFVVFPMLIRYGAVPFNQRRFGVGSSIGEAVKVPRPSRRERK